MVKVLDAIVTKTAVRAAGGPKELAGAAVFYKCLAAFDDDFLAKEIFRIAIVKDEARDGVLGAIVGGPHGPKGRLGIQAPGEDSWIGEGAGDGHGDGREEKVGMHGEQQGGKVAHIVCIDKDKEENYRNGRQKDGGEEARIAGATDDPPIAEDLHVPWKARLSPHCGLIRRRFRHLEQELPASHRQPDYFIRPWRQPIRAAPDWANGKAPGAGAVPDTLWATGARLGGGGRASC